jgi:hypothetical protein
LQSLAGELPVVFFVKNSCLFVGKLIEEEELAPAYTAVVGVASRAGALQVLECSPLSDEDRSAATVY